MTKFLSNSVIIFTFLLNSNWTCSEKVKEELPLEVVNIEVNAWLNLMPGVSPGKFHLTGEITLQNKSAKKINDISLYDITVYSLEEVIYTFKPYFTNRLEKDIFNLEKGMTGVFSFGLADGLKADERIINNEVISLKLNFMSGKDNYTYLIDNVELEETY